MKPSAPKSKELNVCGWQAVSTLFARHPGEVQRLFFDAATGKRLWTAAEGALNPPLVVGGSVFVVNDEARLVRLDASTGDVIWQAEMPYFDKDKAKKHKAITAHYGPVLAGGRIVVASGDGPLRLFDPTTGTMVYSVDIPGGAASAPVLAQGMLFVVGGNGQLHAFR